MKKAMMKKDIVFECRKYQDYLFVDKKKITPEYLIRLSDMNCPNCEEEGYRNWILLREGNYDKEYGQV